MDSFYKVLNEEQHKQAALNDYNFDHPGENVTCGVDRRHCLWSY